MQMAPPDPSTVREQDVAVCWLMDAELLLKLLPLMMACSGGGSREVEASAGNKRVKPPLRVGQGLGLGLTVRG